jgi:hypothetical protein
MSRVLARISHNVIAYISQNVRELLKMIVTWRLLHELFHLNCTVSLLFNFIIHNWVFTTGDRRRRTIVIFLRFCVNKGWLLELIIVKHQVFMQLKLLRYLFARLESGICGSSIKINIWKQIRLFQTLQWSFLLRLAFKVVRPETRRLQVIISIL